MFLRAFMDTLFFHEASLIVIQTGCFLTLLIVVAKKVWKELTSK